MEQREYAYATVRVDDFRPCPQDRADYRENPNNIYYGHMSTSDRDALVRKTAGAIWKED